MVPPRQLFKGVSLFVSDFSKIINNYRIIHHGLAKMASRRGERGVAIVLSPTIAEAYKANSEGLLMSLDRG